MTALEKVLPPSNVIENSDASATTQGFLEIEVSRIYFVTTADEKRTTETPTAAFVTYNYTKNKKGHKHSKVYLSSATPANATARLKLIWTGENRDAAGSVRISSCSKDNNSNRKKIRENNNKIRYQIRSSLALFLDYLRSCEPLEIVVSSIDSGTTVPLSQAFVRLPPVLLRKYAANYGRRCSFEHKTKIYALYNKSDNEHHQRRSGEIQLLFRMLFAPLTVGGKHVATAASIARSGAVLLQDQLLTSSLQNAKETAVVVAAAAAQAEKSSRVPTKSAEEIVEAMKKLDAKLVAYLAGDSTDGQQQQQLEREVVGVPRQQEMDIMTPIKMKSSLSPQSSYSSLNSSAVVSSEIAVQEERFRAQLFHHISAVRLQMEAVTLQPNGTKRMELLQSEIRPIFTVECQLSHELIAGVTRSDMYHIMQFESEKFQSLTQCTRFGHEAQRDVRLPGVAEEKGIDNNTETNFGRLHFTVWWREPGTCLNEMLGMGVLELAELYNASLLEQCKCIGIQRRGVHLASLYFKISLLSAVLNAPAGVDAAGELQLLLDQTSVKKQCNDAGDEKNKQEASPPPLLQNVATQSCGDSSGSIGNGNASSAEANSDQSNNNNNKNHQFASSNFSVETSKVRLLKGFVYASETRNFEMAMGATAGGDGDYFLVCRRFWQDEEASAVVADEDNSFNYQEQFALLNDEKFVSRVDKQHLQLEIWHRRVEIDADGNTINSSQQHVVPLGTVRLPLHQFFIAYRDAVITNHLCKGKLPVISIDAWVPIVSCQTHHNERPPPQLGELKCLLAIGSEEQILNLKAARGFTSSTGGSAALTTLSTGGALLFPAEQIKTNFTDILNHQPNQHQQKPPQSRQTSYLLDMLQRALMTPSDVPHLPTATTAGESPSLSSITSPFKPLQPPNVKSFKFTLDIQRGFGLPLNPPAKSCKKQAASSAVAAKRNATVVAATKRYPPNEAPSTYVTFQADAGHGKLYKSHEGAVYATNVYDKSTQPQWQQRFRVATSIDYLTNPQKHFILKVWKKATSNDLALQNRPIQPTPIDDSIIGFVALDLSALLRGLHIGGAFTIVDFNGRPNGQLEVSCQPLEDLRKILKPSPLLQSARSSLPIGPVATDAMPSSVGAASLGNMDAVIDQFESSLDLSHLNLGHAIKRKFSELEVISQRLRTRLLDVTGTDAQFAATPLQFNASVFDNWQPLDNQDDVETEEFECDINTPPPQNIHLDTAEASKEDVREEKKEATKLISAEAPLNFVGAATADCPKE